MDRSGTRGRGGGREGSFAETDSRRVRAAIREYGSRGSESERTSVLFGAGAARFGGDGFDLGGDGLDFGGDDFGGLVAPFPEDKIFHSPSFPLTFSVPPLAISCSKALTSHNNPITFSVSNLS